MALLIALLPIAVVLILVGTRASMLVSGVAGVAAAAFGAFVTSAGGAAELQRLIGQAARGAWLGWQAAIVVVGGMMFYLALQRWSALHAAHEQPSFSHRRLWLACFLAGPFIESATGYGVGGVVALSVIFGMGIRGTEAITLSLLSQTLVPWGALAVGIYVGSGITHIPPADLSFRTAVLIIPVLWVFQVHFWFTLRRLKLPVSPAQMLEDTLALAAFCGALLLATYYLAPEIALFVGAGVPLVAKWLLDERPGRAEIAIVMRRAAPYLVLCGVLIVTRTWPFLGSILKAPLEFTPFEDAPSFPVFYSAAFWLMTCATLFALAGASRAAAGRFVRESWNGAWRPAAVTVCFMTMAQLLIAANAPAVIGGSLKAALGPHAVLLAPALGSMGGLITGSNAAAVAMFMTIAVDMGKAAPVWTAALQNVAGSTFTLLSPVRVSKVCAMAGETGNERSIYLRYAVAAAVIQGVLLLEAVAIAL